MKKTVSIQFEGGHFETVTATEAHATTLERALFESKPFHRLTHERGLLLVNLARVMSVDITEITES